MCIDQSDAATSRLTIVEAHEIVEMVRRTGADADVILLRDRILLGQNALLGLIVEFDRTTKVSDWV